MDTALHDRLIALFEPVLAEAGYELVEVEFVTGQGGATLRIYIDSPEGIDVDDCAAASQPISDLLDVEDPFPGRVLAGSVLAGPGSGVADAGALRALRGQPREGGAAVPRDGRKRYTGMLRRADGESIEMDVDNFSVSIRLAEISKARLAPL